MNEQAKTNRERRIDATIMAVLALLAYAVGFLMAKVTGG